MESNPLILGCASILNTAIAHLAFLLTKDQVIDVLLYFVLSNLLNTKLRRAHG